MGIGPGPGLGISERASNEALFLKSIMESDVDAVDLVSDADLDSGPV